jgi:hypothetical protein
MPEKSIYFLSSKYVSQGCNGRGVCLSMKQLAERAGRVYKKPWDANKIWGCVCDPGWRGPDCSLQVQHGAMV